MPPVPLPDDVGHLVLVLPHHHPEVPCVADGGQVEIELLLGELLWEEKEGGGEGSGEVGPQGSLEPWLTLQESDRFV